MILGFIGILTNLYSVNYMKQNFDLSKIIYKVLLGSCLITIFGYTLLLITAIYLLVDTNELVCITFQLTWMAPNFIVQWFVFQMSILRCRQVTSSVYINFYVCLSNTPNDSFNLKILWECNLSMDQLWYHSVPWEFQIKLKLLSIRPYQGEEFEKRTFPTSTTL